MLIASQEVSGLMIEVLMRRPAKAQACTRWVDVLARNGGLS